ncbi:polyketide synthase [Nonomuraea dietziae]|uniref:beta-ketoacyl [acyl carrier protein] synthase domain-containing protein n=1 Tax=Nonomuraea dietziae TaxID=65515 RepID=UPI003CD055C9
MPRLRRARPRQPARQRRRRRRPCGGWRTRSPTATRSTRSSAAGRSTTTAGARSASPRPGVQGQAAVMAEALASADLSPADIDYIEAHGTGTALGDAAELAALQQVYGGQSLLIGSVKPNVGHLDRAAGVTNLIKAALALRHDEIPPTLNLSEPNPQLGTGEARLDVVTRLRSWPREAGRIRQGRGERVRPSAAPTPTWCWRRRRWCPGPRRDRARNR